MLRVVGILKDSKNKTIGYRVHDMSSKSTKEVKSIVGMDLENAVVDKRGYIHGIKGQHIKHIYRGK